MQPRTKLTSLLQKIEHWKNELDTRLAREFIWEWWPDIEKDIKKLNDEEKEKILAEPNKYLTNIQSPIRRAICQYIRTGKLSKAIREEVTTKQELNKEFEWLLDHEKPQHIGRLFDIVQTIPELEGPLFMKMQKWIRNNQIKQRTQYITTTVQHAAFRQMYMQSLCQVDSWDPEKKSTVVFAIPMLIIETGNRNEHTPQDRWTPRHSRELCKEISKATTWQIRVENRLASLKQLFELAPAKWLTHIMAIHEGKKSDIETLPKAPNRQLQKGEQQLKQRIILICVSGTQEPTKLLLQKNSILKILEKKVDQDLAEQFEKGSYTTEPIILLEDIHKKQTIHINMWTLHTKLHQTLAKHKLNGRNARMKINVLPDGIKVELRDPQNNLLLDHPYPPQNPKFDTDDISDIAKNLGITKIETVCPATPDKGIS